MDSAEYGRHAARCRKLAAETDGPTRMYLEAMAKEWERRAVKAGDDRGTRERISSAYGPAASTAQADT
jgi:hypothetical protein